MRYVRAVVIVHRSIHDVTTHLYVLLVRYLSTKKTIDATAMALLESDVIDRVARGRPPPHGPDLAKHSISVNRGSAFDPERCTKVNDRHCPPNGLATFIGLMLTDVGRR